MMMITTDYDYDDNEDDDDDDYDAMQTTIMMMMMLMVMMMVIGTPSVRCCAGVCLNCGPCGIKTPKVREGSYALTVQLCRVLARRRASPLAAKTATS